MPKIQFIKIRPWPVRLKNTFITSQGHKSRSNNVWIDVQFESGACGFGEASESLAMKSQSKKFMLNWLKKSAQKMKGKNFMFHPLSLKISGALPPNRKSAPTAWAALESALWMAYSQETQKPLKRIFGPNSKPIKTDITLSPWPLQQTQKVAGAFFKNGFRKFKIKITPDSFETDLRRLLMLKQNFPRSQFWIDGNQGLSWNQSITLLNFVQANKIPIAAFEQLFEKSNFNLPARFKKISSIPHYLDESIHSVRDIKKIVRHKAADGVVIKIAKMGVKEGVAAVRTARHYKLKTMISCMAESEAGLLMSVAWAVGDGRFDWVDLDSGYLTTSPPKRPYYRTKGPLIHAPQWPPQNIGSKPL